MAMERVRRSDLSKELIEDETGARVSVRPIDKSKGTYTLDITDAEVVALVGSVKPKIRKAKGDK